MTYDYRDMTSREPRLTIFLFCPLSRVLQDIFGNL